MAKTPAKKKGGFDRSKFVENVITLPLFKWKVDEPKFVKVLSKVYEGKAVGGTDGTQMEPAHLCQVINLETGQKGEIICGSVLQGVFEDNFEKDEYVGKLFEITQYKVEGKRYKGYKVTELVEA